MKPLLLSSLLLFASGAYAADGTYADFLATARTQFEAKNFDGARVSMQSALGVANTPDEKYGALLRIAKTFDEQKNPVRAREFYERAAAQPGISAADKVGALFSAGDDLRQEKQLDKAQKVFESLLADAQTPPELADVVRFNLGQVLLEQGQTARGRELLKSLGESKAQTYLQFGAWLQLGQSFHDEKNWNVALATFDKALALPGISPSFQAIAHTARIKALVGQDDKVNTQREAVTFAAQMLKQAATSSPEATREPLAAAVAVLELPDVNAPELLVLTAREQLATTFLQQGDFVAGRAQMEDMLKRLQPLEVSAGNRSSALALKTLALWHLAGSYEREGNMPKSRELLGQLLQIPDVAQFYKDAAQKKLEEQKK